MHLNELVILNKPGVYALINPVDKKVYIGVGVSVLKSALRLVDGLKTNLAYKEINKDFGKLFFTVLETCPPKSSAGFLRLRMAVWIQKYEAEGYSLYTSYKGLRLRVNTFLDVSGMVNVELVSTSNKRVLVGIFGTVESADDFIKKNYSPIEKIVYMDNIWTNEYRNKLKM